MTQDLANHRDRGGRMNKFFEDNKLKIQPITDIWDERVVFGAKIEAFDKAAQEQAGPITGLATQKKELLGEACRITCKWGVRCHIKAHAIGNYNLETLLDHRPYEIKHMEDKDGLNTLRDMAKGLRDNLASFGAQGLTVLICDDIDKAIDLYADIIDKPGYAIKERKTDTEDMVKLMADADLALGNAVSLIEAEFFDTDPELVKNMKNENRIDDIGHRFNSIEGEVVKDGGPAAGYVVGIKGTDKSAKADLEGHYRIKGLKVGLCEVELKDKAGVVVQTKVVKVKRGVTLKMDWSV